MAGNSPSEAVHNYLEPLRKAISCVSRAVLVVSTQGYKLADSPHALTFSVTEPIAWMRGVKIGLDVRQEYWIVEESGDRGPWRVQTNAYLYSVLNEDQQEIISYHWHPNGPSPEKAPHLHIQSGAGISREELVKAHIPTGRIALEDVVRLTIKVFGATPLRKDWEEVLDSSQKQFEQYRSWHGSGPQ